MNRHDAARAGGQILPWGDTMREGGAVMTEPRIARLATLIRAALRPPAGTARIVAAIAPGLICHALFAVAVLAIILAMFCGLSESPGSVPRPWALLANAALIAQFPLAHSLLLTGPGGRFLARLPGLTGARNAHHAQ